MAHDMDQFEEMVALVCGELSPEDAKAAEARIAASSELCAQFGQLAGLARTLRTIGSGPSHDLLVRAAELLLTRQPSVPEGFESGLEALLGDLIADTREQNIAFGYRGEATAQYMLTFESEAAEIVLQIAPGEPTPVLHVRGQVDSHNGEPVGRVIFEPSTSGEAVVQTAADADGHFVIELAPGTYTLHVRVGDRIVTIPGVEVG